MWTTQSHWGPLGHSGVGLPASGRAPAQLVTPILILATSLFRHELKTNFIFFHAQHLTAIHTLQLNFLFSDWLFGKYAECIEGFHVTSYQVNFASHHTRDRPVGFLSAHCGIWKYNKMSRYFVSSLFHTTKLKLRDKNDTTHTPLKF